MISCRVSPKTSFSARLGRIRFSNNRQLKYRDEVIGRAKKNSESISQDIPTENLPSEGKVQKDFWEGDEWNVLGEISSLALPIFVALALLVGVFAAQTYNQDADVFLDSPKSDVDTPKLYTFE